MLIIRLQRIGRKNEAAFRMIVTDSKHAAKTGKFHEIVGSYTVKSGEVSIKKDRIKHWMDHGAQVSDTVHNILVKEGVVKAAKKNVLSKKTPTVKRKEAKKK